jgi:hypothetical protein
MVNILLTVNIFALRSPIRCRTAANIFSCLGRSAQHRNFLVRDGQSHASERMYRIPRSRSSILPLSEEHRRHAPPRSLRLGLGPMAEPLTAETEATGDVFGKLAKGVAYAFPR